LRWEMGEGGERGSVVGEERASHPATDAAIAFLDVLSAFGKWTFGFHCKSHGTAMAGPGVQFWVVHLC
jgi:hypothetical protein